MSFIYALETYYNSASTVYNGIALNISNGLGGVPSYAPGSYALNLKNNGNTVFGVDPLGNITGGTITSVNLLPSITSPPYNAVGDGVTDNSAAFTRIQNSGVKQFYAPPGVFFANPATFNLYNFGVQFEGPGQFKGGGSGAWTPTNPSTLPGQYSNIISLPSSTQTDIAANTLSVVFEGDLSHIQPEYWRLQDVRKNLNGPYVLSNTVPHYQWFDNNGGSSGCICRLAAPAIIGATSITVNSIQGVAVGDIFGFAPVSGVPPGILDHVTIVGPLVGTTINFTPALTHNYIAGDLFTNSARTNNSFYGQYLVNSGAGDSYVSFQQVVANYIPLAGQNDVFFTSTTGAFGGAIIASQAGNYLQVSEYLLEDLNNDSAVISDVRNFIRQNATAARGAYWLGTFFNSTGPQPADACYVTGGGWKNGLDTTGATFTGDAIALAHNQKLGFDARIDPASIHGIWGNIPAITYMWMNNNTNVFELYVQGARVFRGNAAGSLFIEAELFCDQLVGNICQSTNYYNLAYTTALPAGGTAGLGYKFYTTTNFGVFAGSGAPTLQAAKGSMYLRSDGSGVNDRAYINTDGNTTWTAIVTVA